MVFKCLPVWKKDVLAHLSVSTDVSPKQFPRYHSYTTRNMNTPYCHFLLNFADYIVYAVYCPLFFTILISLFYCLLFAIFISHFGIINFTPSVWIYLLIFTQPGNRYALLNTTHISWRLFSILSKPQRFLFIHVL